MDEAGPAPNGQAAPGFAAPPAPLQFAAPPPRMPAPAAAAAAAPAFAVPAPVPAQQLQQQQQQFGFARPPPPLQVGAPPAVAAQQFARPPAPGVMDFAVTAPRTREGRQRMATELGMPVIAQTEREDILQFSEVFGMPAEAVMK